MSNSPTNVIFHLYAPMLQYTKKGLYRKAKSRYDVQTHCTYQGSLICWHRQPSLENLTAGLWAGSGNHNTAS